jgi:molecular chaperone GrpE
MSDKTVNEENREETRQQDEQQQAADQEQETEAPVAGNGSEDAVTEEESQENSLEDRLAAAEARAEDNYNQYLRAVAELENSRKRAERDVQHAHKYALERFAGELLNVKDSLEMGLSAARDATDKADALVEGTEMTLKQLDQVLAKFGVEEIAADGATFDPEVHEAMAMQPSAKVKPDHVLTVVQKGYTLNGRVLRPARVLVAKAPDDENGDGE